MSKTEQVVSEMIEYRDKRIAELEAAFDLCYDHLCDLHFAMKNCPGSYQEQILKEIEKTAKTNDIFIQKKKEEDESK